uniref:Uncharacterized protein n=1 Tax=uncultured Armatimonadetes bacterium TaxID=157466 RepID=A0A6J4HXR7_9BACT|nr:hypothetical protein AVDCRST_MAG63-1093 [uncultured Armatimonadetes bacterium]
MREHSLIEATAASPALHPDGDDAPLRFALLETLREFGAELLEETLGEDEAAVLRERHARHFLALAEEAEPHLFGPDPVPWLDRLEAERANLHAALERSLAAGRHERSLEAALRLLRPLARFWRMRGHVGEGRRVYASLLARVRQSASAATTPALAQLEQKALHFAGHLANRQGDYGSARSLFEQGLRLSREREDPKAAADFLSGLGYVAMYQSDFAAARAHHEEALRLCEANRDVISVGSVLYALGHLADFEKKHDLARTYFERALAVWGNHPEGQSGARYALLNLGHGARCTGDFGRARSHYAESLRRFVQAGDRLGVAQALEGFASLIVTDQRTAPEGAARDAALWYGAAERLREAVGTPLPAFARAALHEAPMNAARAILGEAAFTGAWAEGRALPMEQAVGSALAESASCTASDAGTNLTSEEAAAAPTQAA